MYIPQHDPLWLKWNIFETKSKFKRNPINQILNPFQKKGFSEDYGENVFHYPFDVWENVGIIIY